MRFILLSLVLLLTACGWKPMYGTSGVGGQTAESSLANVGINNIPDQEGQYLRNQLIDRFYRHGRPANPAYTLTVDPIKETIIDLDITVESETTRSQITLATQIKLIDNQTGKQVLQRKLKSVNSFNELGSQFATRVSEEDSRKAALNDLARQIELQLSLHFNR